MMYAHSREPQSLLGYPRQRTDQPAIRLAAIDVGSNSIRLLVAHVERDGTYRVLDEEREMTRLGEGLVETGRLSDLAIERSLEALSKMKAIADGFQVRRLRVIATSAVREAANGEFLRNEARRRMGMEVEVIDPIDEARLAFHSAARHFKLDGTLTAVVDIGGGSAEVVLAAETLIERVVSLSLGAVKLTERFNLANGTDMETWKRLRKHIDREIKAELSKLPFVPDTMVGSGGTFTTLAEIIRCRREGKPGSPHGYLMTLPEVQDLFRELAGMTLEQRKRVPGLNPLRADIILAGLAVIIRLAKRLGTNQILVNERGIRDGLLLGMIDDYFQPVTQTVHNPRDRMEWVRVFARKCRSDEQHCEHVTKLSQQIFDHFAELSTEYPESRELLLAAALLHDVGYLINHSAHHKHAYHLIMHGELPGFSARQIEIIANTARYHRRALPKKSHSNFAALDASDRRLVRKLAGILRVADGLDRTHTGRVTGVQCAGSDGLMHFRIHAHTDPHVEMWYAEGKADMFREAFNLTVKFTWNNQPESAAVSTCDASGDQLPQALGA